MFDHIGVGDLTSVSTCHFSQGDSCLSGSALVGQKLLSKIPSTEACGLTRIKCANREVKRGLQLRTRWTIWVSLQCFIGHSMMGLAGYPYFICCFLLKAVMLVASDCFERHRGGTRIRMKTWLCTGLASVQLC